jgi:hypothetical protein
MGFDEQLKLRVKRRAHFRCCLCHDLYVEVHHIVPEADGGPDTEENAAPLCPSCHERYGANDTKRKFIRDAREFWYELCAERYKATDSAILERISSQLKNVATKAELAGVFSRLSAEIQAQLSNPKSSLESDLRLVAHVTSSIASSSMSTTSHTSVALGDIFQILGSSPKASAD